jgi:hypothetical protein
MSYIVVLFYLLDRPWTFDHFVLRMFNLWLNLFIRIRYLTILLLHYSKFYMYNLSYILFILSSYANFSIVPPIIAIWHAASLPLGNIIPYKRSYNVTKSLFFNKADVPIILVAHSLIVTFIYLGFKLWI